MIEIYICTVQINTGSTEIQYKLRDGKSLQNFESVKLAHTICANYAQNGEQLAKTPKIAQQKAKIFNKTHEKTKISTAVQN